jgi:hypothetical protein
MNRLTPAAHKHCVRWLKSAVQRSAATPVDELGLSANIKLTRHPHAQTADAALITLFDRDVAVITYALCLHPIRSQLAAFFTLGPAAELGVALSGSRLALAGCRPKQGSRIDFDTLSALRACNLHAINLTERSLLCMRNFKVAHNRMPYKRQTVSRQ